MDIKEYIESGVLELYVAGSLTEEENKKVYENLLLYPELMQEVKNIESKVTSLTAAVAPDEKEYSFKRLLMKMVDESARKAKVVPLQSKSSNLIQYTGWAASLVIGMFLFYTVSQNTEVQNQLDYTVSQNNELQTTLAQAKSDLTNKENILSNIRFKDIVTVPLQGQKVSPESYAKVYWNKGKNKIFIDVQGLPDPPEGKVYQLWSLKLNPLTPTSLGVLDTFIADGDKIFEITNTNASEAFGITLEPEGGSESPTLEQLYTLGAV